MSFLPLIHIADANILVRLADPADSHHAIAQNAVKSLRMSGAIVRTVPQAIYEFWVVATRPQDKNGMGLNFTDAETFVDYFIRVFWPIPDDPATLTFWRHLIARHKVIGKQAHDARYIAALQAHGLTHLLTFDSDFNRYTAEGITVVHPANVSANTTNGNN